MEILWQFMVVGSQAYVYLKTIHNTKSRRGAAARTYLVR